MAFIGIIIILTASVHNAFSAESVLSMELNIPQIFTNLLGAEESPRNFRTSVGSGGSGVINDLSMESDENKHTVTDDSGKTMKVIEDMQNDSKDYEIIKITVGGINDLATIYQAIRSSFEQTVDTGYQLILPALFKLRNVMRRVQELRPMVVQEPGTIKTEILTYPPNYMKGRLMYLLNLKKKQEERNG